MTDLISVIIPIYNLEAHVGRCIESVLAQSYQALQIILVDDGSQDGSGTICDAYAKKDSRIEVHHKPNGGLSDARNHGLAAARGKYVAFIDADDYVAPDFIKTLYLLCKEHGAQIAQCDFETVTGGSFCPKHSKSHTSVYSDVEMLSNLYSPLYLQTVTVWSKLYETRLFDAVRFPVGMTHEDEATTYKLIYAARRIAVTDAKLYAYFYEPNSITRRPYNERRLDALPILRERAEFFAEKGLVQLAKKAWEKYCFSLAGHLYLVKKHIPHSSQIQHRLRRELKAALPIVRQDESLSPYMRFKLVLLQIAPLTYARLRHKKDYLTEQ